MASTSGLLQRARRATRVASTAKFDAMVVLASLWFIGGLLVDGWAHNNLDLSREGFFTPYHAIFYSGFVAIAAVILTQTVSNYRSGATMRAAIPRGYDITLAGLAIFAVGGVLDMLWHLTFGIEQDLAALFSPTHLLLATGIGSILSGPVRATVARNPARSFREQWPALVTLALFATLISFFCMWAFGLYASHASTPKLLYPSLSGDALETAANDRLAHGIASVALRSLTMVGILLWAARRLALPRGAATLLLVVPSVLVGAMLGPDPAWLGLQAASALVAGIVADVWLARGLDVSRGTWQSRAFAFAVPFTFWTAYVSIASLTGGGLWWTPHLIAGAPVIGGLFGALLELVTEPKAAFSPAQALR